MDSTTKRTEPTGAKTALTVYFDGACPLCSAEIAHYAACRGADRLRFVDLSAADADPGPDLTRRAALARFHVRTGDGRLLSGARAFAAIWAVLPGWRPAARLAALPGIPTVLELGYRAFLPLRPALAWLAARRGARPGAGGRR